MSLLENQLSNTQYRIFLVLGVVPAICIAALIAGRHVSGGAVHAVIELGALSLLSLSALAFAGLLVKIHISHGVRRAISGFAVTAFAAFAAGLCLGWFSLFCIHFDYLCRNL